MKRSRGTHEQLVRPLRQTEAGAPVVELCREQRVAEAASYRWKEQFGDLGVSEVRALRSLREEERKLEQVVAELRRGGSLAQICPKTGPISEAGTCHVGGGCR